MIHPRIEIKKLGFMRGAEGRPEQLNESSSSGSSSGRFEYVLKLHDEIAYIQPCVKVEDRKVGNPGGFNCMQDTNISTDASVASEDITDGRHSANSHETLDEEEFDITDYQGEYVRGCSCQWHLTMQPSRIEGLRSYLATQPNIKDTFEDPSESTCTCLPKSKFVNCTICTFPYAVVAARFPAEDGIQRDVIEYPRMRI